MTNKELSDIMSEEYSKDYCKGYQEGMLYALSAVEEVVSTLTEESCDDTSTRFNEILTTSKRKRVRHEAYLKYTSEIVSLRMMGTRIKSFVTDLKNSTLNPAKLTPEEEEFLNDRGGDDIPLESLSKDIVYPKCEEESASDATDDFDEEPLDKMLHISINPKPKGE